MWHEKYLGISYITMNCAELVAKVLKEELLKPLSAEIIGSKAGNEHADISKHIGKVCKRINEPHDKCGVLFNYLGQPQHMGLMVATKTGYMALNTLKGSRGSSLTCVAAMDRMGMSVEGYYEWL